MEGMGVHQSIELEIRKQWGFRTAVLVAQLKHVTFEEDTVINHTIIMPHWHATLSFMANVYIEDPRLNTGCKTCCSLYIIDLISRLGCFHTERDRDRDRRRDQLKWLTLNV